MNLIISLSSLMIFDSTHSLTCLLFKKNLSTEEWPHYRPHHHPRPVLHLVIQVVI